MRVGSSRCRPDRRLERDLGDGRLDQHLSLRDLRNAVDVLLDQCVLFFRRLHTDRAGYCVDDDIVGDVVELRRGRGLIAEHAVEELRCALAGARHGFGLLQAFFARRACRLGAFRALFGGLVLVARRGQDGGCCRAAYPRNYCWRPS